LKPSIYEQTQILRIYFQVFFSPQ